MKKIIIFISLFLIVFTGILFFGQKEDKLQFTTPISISDTVIFTPNINPVIGSFYKKDINLDSIGFHIEIKNLTFKEGDTLKVILYVERTGFFRISLVNPETKIVEAETKGKLDPGTYLISTYVGKAERYVLIATKDGCDYHYEIEIEKR